MVHVCNRAWETGSGRPHTLNRPPMIERITIAKTETTTLYQDPSSVSPRYEQGKVEESSPAPRVEGGNDGLHSDESMMGGVVDKEMASAKGDRVAVSWRKLRLSIVKIVRLAVG